MNTSVRKHIPQRTCIVCRRLRPKPELLRIARRSDGSLAFDALARLGGRGAYLCREQKCIDMLQKRKGLDRAFRRSIPADIYRTLIEEMSDYVAKKNL